MFNRKIDGGTFDAMKFKHYLLFFIELKLLLFFSRKKR